MLSGTLQGLRSLSRYFRDPRRAADSAPWGSGQRPVVLWGRQDRADVPAPRGRAGLSPPQAQRR